MRELWDPLAVFGGVESLLPPTLVSDGYRERCRAVASSLPPATSSYYLECRLDSDDQVDFLALTRHPNAAALFRESLGEGGASSTWQPTLSLFEAWSGGDPILGEIPFFWLEYDIDHRFRHAAPAASPGFCLEPGYLGRVVSSPIADPQSVHRLAVAGLEHLLPAEDRQRRERLVRRCIECLPRGGSLVHLSAMLAREPVKLKLYVAVPRIRLLEYLGSIGWRGSKPAVERVLAETFADFGRTIFIDVAIAADIEPSLGVALSQFHQAEVPEVAPDWSSVSLPGASALKRRAAAEWPGVTETTVAGARCWIHRWLDIKLVIDADGTRRNKAYLGFMPSAPPPFS